MKEELKTNNIDKIGSIKSPNVIIDTDLGSSIDDLFAIDLAVRLDKLNKIHLLAVMMDRPDFSDDNNNGEFLRFLDVYLNSLGADNVKIGKSMPLTFKEHETVINPYWTLVEEKNIENSIRNFNECLNSVNLYRKLLYEAEDNSVIICSIGFFNNLYELLLSKENYNNDGIQMTGLDLIERKVKVLNIMAGSFDDSLVATGHGEYNVFGDIFSAKYIFEKWPTEIICTPWEVGLGLEYKANNILDVCKNKCGNKVIERVFEKWPSPPKGFINRLWDIMTILPIVENDNLIELSSNGKVNVDDETGVTTFIEDENGNVRYQIAKTFDFINAMNIITSYFKNHIINEKNRCEICGKQLGK